MPLIWDYNIKELRKSKWGRLKILERQINYGIYPASKERVSLKEVKKNWNKLEIEPSRKAWLKLLIWGK